jgi:hypothetical protein
MSKPAAIQSYREFWPYYLHEHSKPATRRLHLAGTGFAVTLVILSAAAQRPWLLVGAVIAGYGPAWLAHFAVEKNRPATFRYPLWSLISDVRMAAIWLAGGLERELRRAGVIPQ